MPNKFKGAKKRYKKKAKAKKQYSKYSKRLAPVISVGAETKSTDVSVAGPTATIAFNSATVGNQNLSTGFLICNLCQQGDSKQTRDGNLVVGRHIGIRFQIRVGANAETSDAYVRYMVVLDRKPNGYNTTLGAILANVDEAGAVTNTFNSGFKPEQEGRYLQLAQNTVTVSKVSGPTPVHHVSLSIPLYKMQTLYYGSANPMTYAYIAANAVYFICFSQMTGAGTLPTIADFVSRYTFSDK